MSIVQRVASGGPSPTDYNLDTLYGLGYRTYTVNGVAKPIIGLQGVISHIDSGTSITTHNGVITYSFLDGPHTIGQYNNPHNGFSRAAYRSPVRFTKPTATPPGSKPGDIRCSRSSDTISSAAPTRSDTDIPTSQTARANRILRAPTPSDMPGVQCRQRRRPRTPGHIHGRNDAHEQPGNDHNHQGEPECGRVQT